ncbi:unnamed protein product [Phytophthora fragariaefolia]|uniref:Unnamed protein product n=1 Tax=Phytophthora fragariaefolia TaxID=1490495 RepID=A0A9W6U3F9_9STRA|nr:unnamed protein product [Phytophthora fragariaefolia]
MRAIQITSLALLWVWTGVQVTTADMCSDQVSPGDKAVGITGENSPPDCPNGGGVGCFGGISTCRFCMAFSTEQSAHLQPCKSTPTVTVVATPTVVTASTAWTAAPTTAPTAAPTAARTAAPTAAPATATTNTSDDDCPELPVA